MQRNLALRKTGLLSLSITVPADFIRARGLQAGDAVHWEVEGDVVTLQFFRVTTTVHKTPALAQQQEAVDAA